MTLRCPARLAICAIFPTIPALYAQTGLVISQIYGGGGNSGATLKNDFVELFNAGPAPIRVDGWSVQYASASGTSWDHTLLSGTGGAARAILPRPGRPR